MNEQYLNELADGIMMLIENEDPSDRNVGVGGTALINDFLRQPGVEESLAARWMSRKRFVCGETRVRVCRSCFMGQILQKRDRLMIMASLGRFTFR